MPRRRAEVGEAARRGVAPRGRQLPPRRHRNTTSRWRRGKVALKALLAGFSTSGNSSWDFGVARSRSGNPNGAYPFLKRVPARKTIIPISTDCQVKLKKAQNAWKPSFKTANVEDEAGKTAEVKRKMRVILNKLTPESYALKARKGCQRSVIWSSRRL